MSFFVSTQPLFYWSCQCYSLGFHHPRVDGRSQAISDRLANLVTILIPEAQRDQANVSVGTWWCRVSGCFHFQWTGDRIFVLDAGFLDRTDRSGDAPSGDNIHSWRKNHPFLKLKRTTLTFVAQQSHPACPRTVCADLFQYLQQLPGWVFMSLMDAYGLSLVSVQVWGTLWDSWA